MILLVFIIVLAIVVSVLIQSFKQSPLHDATQMIGAYLKENEELENQKQAMINHHNQCIEKLKNMDANFSYSEFKRLVATTSAWAFEAKSTHHQKAIANLRKYASASFLNDYVHDIEKVSQLKECSYRNVVLEEMYMKEVKQQNDYQAIIVEAMVRYDYATYRDHRLTRQKEMKSKLLLTYTKKQEIVGMEQLYTAQTHCQNCGAAIDIIHEDKCPYCDSYYYTKSNIWMLHEMLEYQQADYGLS